MQINNWKDLQVGMYVRLVCKCEGYIEGVKRGSEAPSDRGFLMHYMFMRCRNRKSMHKAYADGFGPYTCFFNYNTMMPAQLVDPVPRWTSKFCSKKLFKSDVERL